MSLRHFLFYLLVLCGAFFVSTVVCRQNRDIQRDLSASHSSETEILSENDVYNWPSRKRFRCPSAWGAYPDPDNCAFFYICVAKIATRTRCPLMYQFCKVKRMCLPMLIAVCDDGSGEVTKKEEKTTTQKETQFICPEEKGKFPHPYNCAKYYSCKHEKATLETCQDSQLFDGVKGRCRDAKKVHCGSRLRPTDIPPYEETTLSEEHTDGETETTGEETLPSEESTHSEEETTPQGESTPLQEQSTPPQEESTHPREETTPQGESTPLQEQSTPPQEESTPPQEDSTPHQEETTRQEESTTPQEEATSQEESTPQEESTTVEAESTTKVRVTAPDTTCDVNDLDCIIDDLGETPNWFVCPDDLGSYPHPTSNKLFIFCLNWKPSVKKCGQDLIFSVDHMTCVSP